MFFSSLAFCILRASIEYVYLWSVNFKVHIRRPMSENIQKLFLKTLNSKMTNSWICGGSFCIFTPTLPKMEFLDNFDICLLIWTWVLVDFCRPYGIFAPTMQKTKLESKNHVSCIFSYFCSMYFLLYLCFLIFHRQLKVIFIDNLWIIFTILGQNGRASGKKGYSRVWWKISTQRILLLTGVKKDPVDGLIKTHKGVD